MCDVEITFINLVDSFYFIYALIQLLKLILIVIVNTNKTALHDPDIIW